MINVNLRLHLFFLKNHHDLYIKDQLQICKIVNANIPKFDSRIDKRVYGIIWMVHMYQLNNNAGCMLRIYICN